MYRDYQTEHHHQLLLLLLLLARLQLPNDDYLHRHQHPYKRHSFNGMN
jgi:hypothetical protein